MRLDVLSEKVHTTRQSESTINLEANTRSFDSVASGLDSKLLMLRCKAAYQPISERMKFLMLRKHASESGNSA